MNLNEFGKNSTKLDKSIKRWKEIKKSELDTLYSKTLRNIKSKTDRDFPKRHKSKSLLKSESRQNSSRSDNGFGKDYFMNKTTINRCHSVE